MLQTTHGNLLLANADAIVNTVNTVGVMGKGIALQFRKYFPENTAAYEHACKKGEVKIGQMFVFDRHAAGAFDGPRYIINFPTKKHWRQPSRLEYIDSGLTDLIRAVRELKISSIALPPLGCGNGGLEWTDVYTRIEAAAAILSNVRWLVYEPSGTPEAATMPNRTHRPNMTRSAAIIIELIDRYLVPGFDYPISLLEIQKLVYFQKEAGESLERITFRPLHYGPYSENVAHILSRLDGHYTSGYGDGQNKPDTPITLLPGAFEEAAKALKNAVAVRERSKRVSELIEGYEDPYGMELLSTVHWVATREDPRALENIDAAIAGVRRWSSRKAKLMRDEHIASAWFRLHDYDWLKKDLASH
ncbi:MAG TPA: macro domain-containing protein [Burkholderiales bacterium]|jgi:O-acetyl-ADP-ribose deacetylase (regulator of RNase III)|nr:macro domain-containing protein [Burkholderiales bacterium]